MKRLFAVALLSCAWPAAAKVAGSKHDFSMTGPGPYRAEGEREVCIFCHVSHRAGSESLSNRPDPGTNHRPYESSTLQTAPGAPTGASRICLSCHDGTIAVGQTRTRRIRMSKGGDAPIERGRRSNLGTDLRQSHPVSMPSPRMARVGPPPRGDAVHLDRSGLVQCTSCHDPHEEYRDPAIGKFLVKPSGRAAICRSCHAVAAGAAGTHLTSSATAPDVEGRERTLADAACDGCHAPHAADVRGRLLKSGVVEDDACLRCHATATQKPLQADLAKASAHASTTKGKHDAGEGPRAPEGRRLPETSPAASRHVTCVDCHDPHASTDARPAPPALSGALAGAWGVDLTGERVAPARHEYEICLKCHGTSANKPQQNRAGAGPDRARRAQDDFDLRRVFSPTAVSFHPIAAPGKNPGIPGLLPPWTPASTILCTDCHASDAGAGAGGTGARGPHGSIYPSLLERQYLTRDLTPESPASYALCYKCHDRDVLLSEQSGFLHRRHVVERSAPCSACHDAHGVSRETGIERNNAHLVSFDLGIVRSGRAGAVRYDTAGARHGSCTLTCHGVEHGPGTPGLPYAY